MSIQNDSISYFVDESNRFHVLNSIVDKGINKHCLFLNSSNQLLASWRCHQHADGRCGIQPEALDEQTSEKEAVFFCLSAPKLEKQAGESDNQLREILWPAMPYSRGC